MEKVRKMKRELWDIRFVKLKSVFEKVGDVRLRDQREKGNK